MQCDTNGDGVPDSREFAGSHRYNTAVALAERFAADEGSISTVIIASGESQVDAVTAAGLAGNLNAPVLLTRSNMLPHNVARYIDEQNVTDVVIVGGTAAVPDAIVTAIESLGTRPTVERIAGADRYATAAAIGDRVGGPNSTWCGSDQSAAILVNGGSDGRADAVVVGPLAFRLGLPMLLTGADMLPETTASYLTDNKIERVVVVGGATSVSADVVNTLVEEVGVVNVQRISGGSAAGTSVAIAREMLGKCADVLGTDKDLVALVNRDAIADGITAAPVLGRGLGADGGSIPILLVGNELPAEVSDYLSGTAEIRGGMKTHQRVLAIGGTAVVSNMVMADAVAAAKTSAGLTATINVKVDPATKKYEVGADGGGVFTVTFSDDVQADEVQKPTLYRLNGRRIEAQTDTEDDNEESIGIVDLVFTADRTVRVELSHILEPGDTISVVGGGKVGANGDMRKLEAASLTLGALASAADRAAPVVDIVAVAGATTFEVFVSGTKVGHNELDATQPGDLWKDFVEITKGSKNEAIELSSRANVAAADIKRPGVMQQVTVTVSRALAAGDRIVVRRQAVRGENNRVSSSDVATVKAHVAPGKFEVSSVSIGDYKHTAQAMVTLQDPSDTDVMVVEAKAGGKADGAVGNGWVIYGYDDRPGADPTASTNAFDIDVAVDMANQVISYTISEVKPTKDIGRVANISHLAAALVKNSDFNANFSVDYVRGDDGTTTQSKTSALGATDPAGSHFIGGTTAVGVEVRFNDAVESLATDGADLAGDIAPMIDATADPADTTTVSFRAPDNVVHISYTSASMMRLPKRAGFRVIAAGVATSYGAVDGTDTTNIREILNSLRPDSRIKASL